MWQMDEDLQKIAEKIEGPVMGTFQQTGKLLFKQMRSELKSWVC